MVRTSPAPQSREYGHARTSAALVVPATQRAPRSATARSPAARGGLVVPTRTEPSRSPPSRQGSFESKVHRRSTAALRNKSSVSSGSSSASSVDRGRLKQSGGSVKRDPAPSPMGLKPNVETRKPRSSPARRPERIPTPGEEKHLSFVVDCTLGQIQKAIKAEDPNWNFNLVFWQALLSGEPSPYAKPLRNRTLTYWVNVFRRWRESDMDFKVSGVQLRDCMFLSNAHLKNVIRLFDREGFMRMELAASSSDSLSKVHIPVGPLLSAGIMLSALISTHHKLRFLMSFADRNDDGALSQEEFTRFLKNFTLGLGGAYGAPAAVLPTRADIATVAGRLFKRILAITKHGDGVPCDALPFEKIQEWCIGTVSDEDPMALPYRLSFERHCPQRVGNDLMDEFDTSLSNFTLTYTSPLPVMEDSSDVHSGDLLTRAEVILARDVFTHAKGIGRLGLTKAEMHKFVVEAGRGGDTTARKMLEGLDKLVKLFCKPAIMMQHGGAPTTDRVGLFDYFRALCPQARPKHLRMFDVWLEEYTDYQHEVEELHDLTEGVKTFVNNDNKPVLPPEEQKRIEEEFNRLDVYGKGFVSLHDVVRAWHMDMEAAMHTIGQYSSSGDACLDKESFLRMMCPDTYRLPTMAGFAREVFGKVLFQEASELEASVEQTQNRYARRASCPEPLASLPLSALPVVPSDTLDRWNDVFDDLDRDDDDRVQVRDLECSGLLSTTVCYCIARLIDPGDKTGFAREGFIAAMCKAHGYRRKLEVDT